MLSRGVIRKNKRAALGGALACSHWLGIDRLIDGRYGGMGSILMFHSVVDDVARHLDQDIHVQVDRLREIVKQLKFGGRDIVSLDEALERLRHPRDRRFVVLTFDDGYRNNLTHALPVLESLGTPFTIYINSNMINGTLDAWWLGLRDLVLGHDTVEVDSLNVRFPTGSGEDKRLALLLITDWVHADIHNRVAALRHTFRRYGVDAARIARAEALDLADVRRLANHTLVTIGGHAETHLPLNSMPAEDALADIARNKKMLEDAIQREVRHFAYPFGGRNTVGLREARIAQTARFASAVTTRVGNLFPEHLAHPFLLPRLAMLNGDHRARLRAKMAGAEQLFRHPMEPPVRTL